MMNKSNNVVITGISSGIGLACAELFIRKGFKVFGSVRTTADKNKVAEKFGSGLFHPLIFDITDEAAVIRAAELVKQELNGQGLSCLINNAGVAISGPLMHLTVSELENPFKTNVFGSMNVIRAFLPLLGAQKDCSFTPGKIINVSSVSGKIVYPFLGPYAASKHALEALSDALRRELAIYGIDVLVVAPGSVQSEIWQKNSLDLIRQKFGSSDWADALQEFKTDESNFMKADLIARKIWNIYIHKNLKTRYPVVKNSFINWFLPRIIPARLLDLVIKKVLKLRRLT